MNRQLKGASAYLQEVLGTGGAENSWERPWLDSNQLPYFLQDQYTFSQAVVLGHDCLYMMCREESSETPAIVRKHWEMVNSKYPGDVIYLMETLTSFNRKRLIEQKVPFMVPGNQLYLPMFGVDLREHFKQAKKTKNKWISAAAQVLVLRQVLGSDERALPAKELAVRLGYSPMTLTRAIKELVDKELATAEMVGKEKPLEFVFKTKELWQVAKPYIRNPVKQRVWVAEQGRSLLLNEGKAKIAGESALAGQTMIADPKNEVLAVSARDWPGFRKLLGLKERKERDVDCIQVELWRYSPGVLTEKSCVDPLSLWLSLFEHADERIEMALDVLIENVWSKS
jgi:DNA-binding transcriptional ArsR family regulator